MNKKKKSICPFCEGTKYVPVADEKDVITCPDCEGKGYVYPYLIRYKYTKSL